MSEYGHIGHLGLADDPACPVCDLREHVAKAIGTMAGGWWEDMPENFRQTYRDYADAVLGTLGTWDGDLLVVLDALTDEGIVG